MTAPLRWNAPPPEAVKVNIDASFDTLSSNAGCGILVRNARGCVISCFCLSPLMAESLALLTALCLAISSGPGHQLLESDSLLLVSLHNAADEIYSLGTPSSCSKKSWLLILFDLYTVCA